MSEMSYHISGASLRRHVLFWVAALIVFIVFLWAFRSILLPFVAGMALAYFLDPVADWLERRGLSRMMASVVILVCFVLIFVLSLMIIIPVIVSQLNDFAAALPGYVSRLQELIATPDAFLPDWLSAQIETAKQNFSNVMSEGAGFITGLLRQIWASGKTLLDI